MYQPSIKYAKSHYITYGYSRLVMYCNSTRMTLQLVGAGPANMRRLVLAVKPSAYSSNDCKHMKIPHKTVPQGSLINVPINPLQTRLVHQMSPINKRKDTAYMPLVLSLFCSPCVPSVIFSADSSRLLVRITIVLLYLI